ncbi:Ribosome biogenesis ERB1 [Quillaja saponaria]|uniref:Ribosome biogenesis ERB1 n=1 Tax=Quillaja saponaria TaxID=32244 RepID=A0AAD7VCS7_QUISA|nr:Ribosome biogenesis ERB1 [Quillaja saponaria]
MVLVQASKLNLSNPSFSSPGIASVLFEPNSLSLALMHSDSSLSLYPSFSPLSSTSLPSPQTLISAPSSSSTFLLLQNSNPNSHSRVLFIVSGPYRTGAEILLRFYILQKSKCFTRAQVVCSQKGLRFDNKLGVLINVKHAVAIKLAGSINYFAMYSVSSSKILIFAVKMEGDDEDGDGVVVKLMRCAVIECCKPVCSISVSFGFLILGEENGVRVFNLRRLVKGRVRRVKNSNSNLKSEVRGLSLPNGVINDDYGRDGVRGRGGKQFGFEGTFEVTCNGALDGKMEKHSVPVTQRSSRLQQDDKDGGSCFVALKRNEVESKAMRMQSMSVKAISIQALSQRMLLILDSDGDLHLLCLSNPVIGADITCLTRQLPRYMKVQTLSVLPDISSRTQTVWLSDGDHTVHMLATLDMENAPNEKDGNNSDEKLLHLPVAQCIFASERIQDVVPLAANAILILGQVFVGFVSISCLNKTNYIGLVWFRLALVFQGLFVLEAYMHMQYPELLSIYIFSCGNLHNCIYFTVYANLSRFLMNLLLFAVAYHVFSDHHGSVCH